MGQKTAFSKGLPWLGPIVRFARNPYAFMQAAGMVNDHLNGCSRNPLKA